MGVVQRGGGQSCRVNMGRHDMVNQPGRPCLPLELVVVSSLPYMPHSCEYFNKEIISNTDGHDGL
jgi:hypothetical protein